VTLVGRSEWDIAHCNLVDLKSTLLYRLNRGTRMYVHAHAGGCVVAKLKHVWSVISPLLSNVSKSRVVRVRLQLVIKSTWRI
jgi:hypothetical protein